MTDFRARIWDRSDSVCGAGFLIDPRHVVTCAHVVNTATGADPLSKAFPEGPVALDFPWSAQDQRVDAQVVGWHAPWPANVPSTSPLADVAVLRLRQDRPEEPADLDRTYHPNRVEFSATGFPGILGGQTVRGTIEAGKLVGHRRQVVWNGPHTPWIEPGFSGAPALVEDKVVGMVFALAETPGVGYLVPGYKIDRARLLVMNPYKGLVRFEPEDAAKFFGRDDEAVSLAGLIGPGATLVVGPTGSGKSSLVFGGALPKLAELGWLVASFRPGFEPVLNLAKAIAGLPGFTGTRNKMIDLLLQVQDDSSMLQQIAAKVLRGPAHREQRLLLIADQMEEAFTLCKDDKQREQFFGVISVASSHQTDRVGFLGTLRAEFIGHVLKDKILGAAIEDHRFFMLRPVARSKFPVIIRKPAGDLGVTFEADLVDQLLDDARDEANPLPLLEFSLQRLWRHLDDHRSIRLGAYAEIGNSLRQALVHHADEMIASLSEHERQCARLLLCMLVNFNADTTEAWSRYPRSSKVLEERDPELWLVAKRLARKQSDPHAGLVVINKNAVGDDVADLVHEELISSWPTLKKWIREARDLQSAFLAVKDRRGRWIEQGSKEEDLLPSGYDLERGLRLLDSMSLLPVEEVAELEEVREFIEASDRARSQEEQREDLKTRELALARKENITKASRKMLQVEKKAKSLCSEVLRQLGFTYASVQLVNKGERTIGTIHGDGLQSDWFEIANHRLESDDPAFLDIQAHIAAKPPRIEIIAGHDDRFDKFIFDKFGHDQHVRVFVPILLSRGDLGEDRHSAQRIRWDWDLVSQKPHVASAQPGDKRHAYEATAASLAALGPYEIIGTIEAGFPCSRREIDLGMAKRLVEIGHRHAPELHQTSLQYVFETLVDAANKIMEPAAIYLGFAYNAIRSRFEYEARAGNEALLEVSGMRGRGHRVEPVGSEIVPMVDDASTHPRTNAYRLAYPAAYAAGVRAEALVPIKVDDQEGRPTQLPFGVLHLVYSKEKEFYQYDETNLKSLASRAEEAIRLATGISRSRIYARGLRNLHHIASALAGSLDQEKLLNEVAGYAMNMFATDLVTVYEFDSRTNTFLPGVGTAGYFKERDKIAPHLLDKNAAPFLLLQKKEHQYENELYAPVPVECGRGPSFVVREDVKSVGGVILWARKEIVGVMFLNYRMPYHFSKEERYLAEALASTAAIAIRNRRMMVASGGSGT